MQSSLTEKFDLGVDKTFYFGEARVITVAKNKAKVSFQEHVEWASLAVGYPYQLCVGDIVVVASQDSRCYIIGILEGKGETVLSVPADLKLKAPRGSIELIASKGIKLRSPDIVIISKNLQMISKNIGEYFDYAIRNVKETYEIYAANIRNKVDGDYRVQADRINQRAKKEIKLDGKKIHLG